MQHSKYVLNNVFLCYTSFHVTFSLAIIRKHSMRNCKILYLGNPELLDKFDYGAVERIIGFASSLLYISKVRNKCHMYCANFKMFKSRFLAKLLSPSQLYSFDDGLGTKWGAGYFYESDDSKLKSWALRLIAEPNYLSFWKERVELHFTCYRVGSACLNKKTEFIGLRSLIETQQESDATFFSDTLVILGNSCVEERMLSNVAYQSLLTNLVILAAEYKTIVYYSHPREEKEQPYFNFLPREVVYIKNVGLAEKFIMTEAPSATVVSFYSSTSINLKALGFEKNYNYTSPALDKIVGDIDKLKRFLLESGVKSFDEN